MEKSTISFFRVAIVLVAPAIMMAAFLYHPHVGNPIDPDFLQRLAAAVIADPTRWGIAHLMASVGSGLLALAFLAVRGHLRDHGENRWSAIGFPLIIMGSVFYALLPAIELAPMAAANIGGDVEATQAALMSWFVPILLTSAVLFGVGAICFATAIVRSAALDSSLAWLVAGSLVVMAACRFVPVNFFQFYVQSVAGLVALWPLAYVIWRSREQTDVKTTPITVPQNV